MLLAGGINEICLSGGFKLHDIVKRMGWLQTGLTLVIGFIEHLQTGNTINYQSSLYQSINLVYIVVLIILLFIHNKAFL
jgi:hypothetical protein